MSKKKFAAGILILTIIFSIGIYLHHFENEANNPNLSCTISYMQHDNRSRTGLLIYLATGKKFGYFSIVGNHLPDDGAKVSISRKVLFTFEQDGQNYIFHSKNNLRFPDDSASDELLKSILPAFFLEPDKELFMKIVPQPANRYVIFIDSIPICLCQSVI